MSKTPDGHTPSDTLDTEDCPKCSSRMQFTGLPDVSGPVYVRFYRCARCGIVRQEVNEEGVVGWG